MVCPLGKVTLWVSSFQRLRISWDSRPHGNAPAANLGTYRQTTAELSFCATGYATALLTSVQVCHLSTGFSVYTVYKLLNKK